MSAQLWALAVAGAVVLAAAGLETLRSRMARRAVATGSPSGQATGVSVFYYLKNMHAGDKVLVTLADGKVATFAVDGLHRVAKDAFPTASVYGKAGYPSLRLITCGGPFDQATGHYVDNIIVYAHLVPAGS